jgi:hypothetical protein
MKKMIIVLLSLAMVLAFAGTAYAATTGNNDTNTWNPPGPTYSYPGAPAAGLRTGSAIAAGVNPHAGYLTTTDKCEVCHSPHQAGTSGSSFKLLYGTTSGTGATGACLVCHVAGSLAIHDVYRSAVATGGHDLAVMTGGVPDSSWATANVALGCSDCHTVHGAGAMGTGAFILRTNPTWNSVAASSGLTASNQTQFCLACHNLNYAPTANGISHYMGAANGAGSTGGAGRIVASSPSTNCDNCHAAPKSDGTTDGSSAKWPHQSISIVGLGHGYSGTDVTDQNHMDDHCLTCHGGSSTGVGFDY